MNLVNNNDFDNLSLVLHKKGDLRLEQTKVQEKLNPDGKYLIGYSRSRFSERVSAAKSVH